MDGPTAVMQIRALGYVGPIVGVTGNMMAADVSHFTMCGADVVLPKPLVVADLEAFLVSKTP
jgi:CheY-like chemotaxis protein